MTSRDETLRALHTDWTDATVERERPAPSIVHSVRLSAEASRLLEDQARERGLTPSALIRELVEAALRTVSDDTPVTITAADLHRAIDAAIARAA